MTQPSSTQAGPRRHLVLADGTTLSGTSFGAECDVGGEVVFSTGMYGYIETLTDPSYRGQILVQTYPLQGNYGVPDGPFESGRIQVQGLVVSRYSLHYSHHKAVKSLSEWLVASGVPAVEGVDTRRLTKRLREHGTLQGCLVSKLAEWDDLQSGVERVEMRRVAHLVAPPTTQHYAGSVAKILLIDTGAKESIVRSLQNRGVAVIRVPFFERWEDFLADVDGVIIGNGPGDPRNLVDLSERLRALLARGLPTFGICFGHQLLSMAAGAGIYKLKYGHRSLNQPVVEIATGRAFITSQNHGYAVNADTLPGDWEPWFVNLNDGSNEGIRHRHQPFFSVQFHPEAAPGPHDTAFLFDEFVCAVAEVQATRVQV